MSRITLDNYEAYLLDFSEGKLSEDGIRQLEKFFNLHPELDIRSELNLWPELPKMNESFDEKADLLKSQVYLEDEKLINYLEGLANADEISSIENELNRNPEVRQKLALYQATRLHKEVIDFDRSFLYKNEDDLLLANTELNFVEGCLSEEQRSAFESKMKSDPSLNKEVVLLSKTKLIADEQVVFENKESLKKEGKVIVLFSWTNIARVAAILVLVFSLFLPSYLRKDSVNDVQVATVKSLPETEPAKSSNKEKITGDVEVKDKDIKEPSNSNQSLPAPSEEKHLQSDKKLLAVIQETEALQQIPASNSEKGIMPHAAVTNNENEKEQTNIKDTAIAFESFANISELEFTEEIEDLEPAKPEGGFWKRAVSLAKQANKLGVKSIEGEENTSVKYRLSFNSFSVEKR